MVQISSRSATRKFKKISIGLLAFGVIMLALILMSDRSGPSDFKGLILGLGSLAAGLYYAYQSRRHASYAHDPLFHPFFETIMARYGRESPIEKLEKELVTSGRQVRDLIFTDQIIIDKRALQVYNVDSLLWVHGSLDKRSLLGMISFTHASILLYSDDGTIRTMKCSSEDGMDEILQTLSQEFPWLLNGFSEELTDAWSNNPSLLVEAVAQRRENQAEVSSNGDEVVSQDN